MPPVPALATSQARLVDVLFDRVQQWAARTPLISRVTKATVVSVAAGGAADGGALVVVSWRGTDVAAPYISSYTPNVTDVVAVAKTGSQLLILGRIVGTP